MSKTRERVKKWTTELIFFAVVIGLVVAYQSRNLLTSDGSVEVSPMRLVSLDQQVHTLPEEGARTLVYFFAPWCQVCAASIGNLDSLESENLTVQRVALDYDSVEDVQDFVTNNEVNGTVLLGQQALKQQFNILGYPTYYIVDENRKIVASAYGYSTTVGMKINNFLNSD